MAATYKAITEIPGWLNRLTGDGVPDSNAQLYGQVPYLFRLVQIRCDTLASIPIKLYGINDEEDLDEKAWPYPSRLTELIWKWEASMLLAGAAYGEIVKNKGGYQKNVVYRNPYGMNVRYIDDDISQYPYIEIKQNQTGAIWKNNFYTGEYEMVYFAEFDPTQDLLPGVSPGKAGNIDAKLLFALSKFPETYFEGGAMPVTLLGIDSTDKSEIDRVANWFKKSATAIKNAFRVLGIRAGSITPTTLTPPLKDLAMPELNAEAKHNLSVAFGVPKTMLDSEAANYATAQEDRLSFYEDTIKPRARMYESVLNEQLLTKEDLRIEFKFNELELFQDDENIRADLVLKYVKSGLPVELALDLAGKQLTEEQAGMLAEKQDSGSNPIVDELGRWMRMAEKRVKSGRDIRDFETDIIPPALHASISGALETVKDADEVKAIFDHAMAWQGYP